MAVQSRALQRPRHRTVHGIGAIVAIHAAHDVSRRNLERRGARAVTAGCAAHAIGDHRDEGESLVVERQPLDLGEIRSDHVHAAMDGREEVVILVARAHLSAVGDAVDVDLLVTGLSIRHGFTADAPKRHFERSHVCRPPRVFATTVADGPCPQHMRDQCIAQRCPGRPHRSCGWHA